MHECYAIQILKAKTKKKKTKTKKTKQNKTKKQKQKKNGHKEYRDETQGPCQKDSIRLSLLHPRSLRCNSSIRVTIHIKMMSNSKIGIKV